MSDESNKAKEALTPITWPTVKWLKPSVAEQHKQSTTCGEPVAWMDREGERVVTAKQKAGMHESLQTSFPYALGYTTPPHSFFEDVANELRVEIAELQDHIRLLEKQLSQPSGSVEQEPVARFGWKWMMHPSRNKGDPIPVQIFEDDGVIYYRPFDLGATEFEWEEKDDDWRDVISPPQRTWVDLTDEQMWNAYTGGSDIINLDYAKSILELFKEKNT